MPSTWHSSKYSLEDLSWDEIRNLPVPELGCSFGGACESLRKNWYKFKAQKREGDRGWDTILRINRIQRALGLEPLTEFSDGPPIEWVIQQLDLEEGFEQSGEELELRYEEDNQDLSEPSEIEGEDPEYAQLRKEERESALADAGIDPYESEEEKQERKEQSDWF